MLKIVVPASEWFNSETDEFVTNKEQVLLLEHSLISISKWESKWHKPFLLREEKTPDEQIDYFRCMTVSKGVDTKIYKMLPPSVVKEIYAYMEDPMTATTFPKSNQRPTSEIVTSELVYYWMTTLGIPFECERWHFNRLITLIRVCAAKNGGGKKMSRSEIAAQNRALNEARRARLKTKG